MPGINLAVGGASWSGWHFGPWGRAKEWRLHAPDGAVYIAGELADLRATFLDANYLKQRVRELEGKLGDAACRLSIGEVALLRAAAAVLMRALPAEIPRSRIARNGDRIPRYRSAA